MSERVYNFSAGPAVLPVEVLEEARENLLSLGNTGIGILEHSHRGKVFLAVYEEAVSLCRELAGIPDDYDVLFLQGGASTQFFQIPMNFLTADRTADYLITGSWSKKAIAEAKRFGKTHVVCSSQDRNFCYIPQKRDSSPSPTYVHFTSNNTIYGTEFREEPEVPAGAFLVCDASSDIFSRPLDIKKYGLIYAGAQKNLGPSGVTLVIIRKDLVDQAATGLPTMLQYRTHANERLHVQHAAHLRHLHHGAGFQMAEEPGRPGGDPKTQPGKGREAVSFSGPKPTLPGDRRRRQPLADERDLRHRRRRFGRQVHLHRQGCGIGRIKRPPQRRRHAGEHL